MFRSLDLIRTRGPKAALGIGVAGAGFAATVLVGVAIANTFTLQVGKSARVTNQAGTTKTENIVVTGAGRAVYTLTGDTASHPKCTKANGCFSFWPPVTVASAKKLSKAAGIHGKLGVFHRNGFSQVTLAGHPLYRYAGDRQKDHATGEGINAFGGIWHVQGISGAGASTPPSGSSGTSTYTVPATNSTMPTSTTTTTSTTPTTTTTACAYPPYC
jgi:predicted lipoprotein with Yx(FWY)xxD motif